MLDRSSIQPFVTTSFPIALTNSVRLNALQNSSIFCQQDRKSIGTLCYIVNALDLV